MYWHNTIQRCDTDPLYLMYCHNLTHAVTLSHCQPCIDTIAPIRVTFSHCSWCNATVSPIMWQCLSQQCIDTICQILWQYLTGIHAMTQSHLYCDTVPLSPAHWHTYHQHCDTVPLSQSHCHSHALTQSHPYHDTAPRSAMHWLILSHTLTKPRCHLYTDTISTSVWHSPTVSYTPTQSQPVSDTAARSAMISPIPE